MVRDPDPVALAVILARILERLGVRYCIGGSVASSVYGEVRTTLDVDIVTDLADEHVAGLLAALGSDFHVVADEVRRVALSPEAGSEVELASAEDVVIHKLRWFDMGGRVSDRQWRDVLGVLKVQGASLDFGYLRRAAASIGLSELLVRARSEAGA